MDDLGRVVIEEVRGRLVSGFPQQVRACLDALSDEQIWWRPNPGSNSIGNLVLHLCGSTRHFLGRAVGGTDFGTWPNERWDETVWVAVRWYHPGGPLTHEVIADQYLTILLDGIST